MLYTIGYNDCTLDRCPVHSPLRERRAAGCVDIWRRGGGKQLHCITLDLYKLEAFFLIPKCCSFCHYLKGIVNLTGCFIILNSQCSTNCTF